MKFALDESGQTCDPWDLTQV